MGARKTWMNRLSSAVWLAIPSALYLGACDDPGGIVGAEQAGGASLDAEVEPGRAGADAGDPRPRWAGVRRAVLRSAAGAGVDMALAVWDASEVKRFEVSTGAFTLDTRVAIASASKLVSGLVLFDVMRRGQLALSSTTGEVLGWAGPNAAITLQHLLSFTSGLPGEAACTANARMTLAECVDIIEGLGAVAPPGTRFDYGSTHLHVAARMAEVATGETWRQLFDETLRTPLALPSEAAYFTFPRQRLGQNNPLVAGGLRMTMNEYAPLLGLALQRGVSGALTLGTPELFDAQAREPFDVAIGHSPMTALGYPFHYGLTAWLECPEPRDGCEVLSSPGAFGFTPWLDRATGYVAILGMEIGPATADTPSGAVDFAVDLEQTLQPLIREALAP